MHTRARTKAGRRLQGGGVPLLASCEARRDVGSLVIIADGAGDLQVRECRVA
jgi:hypothetical protein